MGPPLEPWVSSGTGAGWEGGGLHGAGGLDHGACENARAGAGNIAFPDEVRAFAENVRRLPHARESCDHDPAVELAENEARFHVNSAQNSIAALRGVSERDRLAFATWTLLTSKGTERARKRAKLGDPAQIGSPPD